jgi:hypothetical protein
MESFGRVPMEPFRFFSYGGKRATSERSKPHWKPIHDLHSDWLKASPRNREVLIEVFVRHQVMQGREFVEMLRDTEGGSDIPRPLSLHEATQKMSVQFQTTTATVEDFGAAPLKPFRFYRKGSGGDLSSIERQKPHWREILVGLYSKYYTPNQHKRKVVEYFVRDQMQRGRAFLFVDFNDKGEEVESSLSLEEAADKIVPLLQKSKKQATPLASTIVSSSRGSSTNNNSRREVYQPLRSKIVPKKIVKRAAATAAIGRDSKLARTLDLPRQSAIAVSRHSSNDTCRDKKSNDRR